MKRYLVRPCTPHARSAVEAVAVPRSRDLATPGAARTISGQQVLDMSERDAAALARARPDVIVEEDHPLDLFGMPGLAPVLPVAGNRTWSVTTTSAEGEPIGNCTVFASGPEVTYRAETDATGQAHLDVDPARIDRLIVSPRANYWSRVIPPPLGDSAEVTLRRLEPIAAMQVLRRLAGMGALASTLGRGVSVAIVDSGVSEVAGLVLAGGHNALNGQDPASYAVDDKGHGTHVAGVIAANHGHFQGLAPMVSLYAIKVFPGGYVSDLVEAVDWCRENHIDLVNLSLGGQRWSLALDHAIRLAAEAGVTMVAAAGNDATNVAFPAAHSDVIAVGAVGLWGAFYEDSGHSLRVGRYSDWTGQLFASNFTNFGPEVNVCAQGVAVASSVPSGFASWDGTSMATPIVTALLAHALELNPALRTGTRATPDALRTIAAHSASQTGIPHIYQGYGLMTGIGLLAALYV